MFCCSSNGEAGETRVDLLAGSVSESLDSYNYWVDACLGDGEADESLADSLAGFVFRKLALSGEYVHTGVGEVRVAIIQISEVV